MTTVNVERESLEAIRDGFIVVKALLHATPEEIALADKEAIAAIVNGGYETLMNLLWQAEPTNLREELRKAAELNRQRPDWTKRGMPTLRPEAQAAGEDES